MVFRSVSPFTYLLPLGLLAFVLAVALDRSGARARGDVGRAIGWLLLAGFWLAVAQDRLLQARFFLGITALLAAGIFAYVASLSVREHPSVRRLSLAFLVMGGLYAPFQLLEPVHSLVVEFVAESTSLGLNSLGYVSIIEVGTQGHRNAIVVTGGLQEAPVTMSILSACTGISAIALFAGLIAAADCPIRHRLTGILAFGGGVFVLNIVRNVFTIVAYREHSFAFLAGVEFPLVTLSEGPKLSYTIAEQVVAPIYIVVGTVIVYRILVARYPSVDQTVNDVVATLITDVRRATGSHESGDRTQ